MSTKKRVVLTAAQKHEICKAKEKNPNIKNIDLANQYSVGKLTITDILKEKERCAYDDLQNGVTKEMAEYNVYNAILNVAE
ncbi:18005_t:CDS:2, partial [Racocetra persica]